MVKINLLVVFFACTASLYTAESMSRWFSATYQDLRFTLKRYGHCVSDLAPIRDYTFNETDYLIHQIRVFLDQGNYDNEQLANVTSLMDNVCRSDIDTSYPISVHIDVHKYNGTTGKENRCRAIDEAMDSMFFVFKKSALNRSEPLDFSVIHFYPNATDKSASYNLTDLINTSWIQSETILEHVCRITGSVKEYVRAHPNNISQKRSDQQSYLSSIIEFLDRLMDPILGLQKRLYWESTNRLEKFQNRISYGFGSVRDGIGSRLNSTRHIVSNLFLSSTNSTRPGFNSTSVFNSTVALNSTQSFNSTGQRTNDYNTGVAMNGTNNRQTGN